MLKYKFLSFNILKKKKLCQFSIVMFSVMIVFCIFINGLSNGLKRKYEKLKEENINHSYIVLNSNKTYEEIIKDIEKLEHIVKFYPVMLLETSNQKLTYFDNNLIKLLDGSYPKNKNDVIVSSNSGKKINDIIKINIYNHTFTLKVVGVYDVNNQNFPFNDLFDNYIYTSFEFINDIVNNNNISSVIIQVTDYKKVSSVVDKITKMANYDIILTDENSLVLDRYDNFSKSINNLSKFLMLFSCLIIAIVQLVIIYDNKLDIAILKSLGYRNLKISVLILFYSLILLVISIIPSIFILALITIFLKELIILNIAMFIKIFFSFLILIIIVTSFFYFFIKKINIIKLIKD